ncbi:MAG: hypothetical protein A2622_13995 [Bdellovibrionales bacterium RIFCSPHIGHO2_01_FULL_40_29]|nr:MAG: hypothetical protein A2622_13995 [Bdellovibrionales bacterium RIFCSPHIGHO2_01_FULL_40_29]OFZ33632.1 MAG: hypothetical protein A3D17_11605 [Bdellovibrionales bacterium RIFCSPHIGHO2_02_FULL_40_15]
MKIISGLLCALLTVCSVVAEEGYVLIRTGEKVYFHSEIFDSKAATFLMLPGIYRGLDRDDKIIKLFIKNKVNYVAIHFSGHPSSVLQLEKNETAIFKSGNGLTSQILADEVAAVSRVLEIKRPIIVSLSYSSTVVQYLDPQVFPVAIETAPLGAFGEEDPVGTAQRKAWADWLKLWPGNYLWVQAATDKAYRDHWSVEASERAANYPGINVTALTEGYMAMARAIEDYDIRTQDFLKSPRRIWVLAENEDEFRRQLQDEAVAISNQVLQRADKSIVVSGSGHNIPMEQPQAYYKVLMGLMKNLKSLEN